MQPFQRAQAVAFGQAGEQTRSAKLRPLSLSACHRKWARPECVRACVCAIMLPADHSIACRSTRTRARSACVCCPSCMCALLRRLGSAWLRHIWPNLIESAPQFCRPAGSFVQPARRPAQSVQRPIAHHKSQKLPRRLEARALEVRKRARELVAGKISIFSNRSARIEHLFAPASLLLVRLAQSLPVPRTLIVSNARASYAGASFSSSATFHLELQPKGVDAPPEKRPSFQRCRKGGPSGTAKANRKAGLCLLRRKSCAPHPSQGRIMQPQPLHWARTTFGALCHSKLACRRAFCSLSQAAERLAAYH